MGYAMSMFDTLVRYPFELFASPSLVGKSHSSTSTLKLHQVRPLNAAQTQLSVNAAHGNVLIQDKQFKIDDDGMSLMVGMVWNSTDNSWRFSAQTTVQVQQIDNGINITEADGRVIQYTKNDNHYICNEPDQYGLSVITIENGCCTRFFPKTGMKEVFNEAGKLQRQILAVGATVEYVYENNELSGIVLPSQRQIKIAAEQAAVKLNLVNPDNSIAPICTYQQDPSGSLTTTIPQPDGSNYKTKYDIQVIDGKRKIKITSDDQTEHELTLLPNGQLQSLREGDNKENNTRLWEFSLNENKNKLTVCSNSQPMMEMDVDNAGHVASFKQSQDEKEIKFKCDVGGRVNSITDKSGNVSENIFDHCTGLLKHSKDTPNGLAVECTYHSDINSPLYGAKLTSTIRDGEKEAKTRFVYNEKRQCVFEVSAEGRVQHFSYDEKQPFRLLKKHKLPLFYPKEKSLAEITAWFAAITPERFITTVYGYDVYGRKNSTRVVCGDDVLSAVVCKLDNFGRETEIQTLATTKKQEFDGLGRPIFASEADNESQYEYQQNKTTIKQSNGLVTEKYIDSCGQETDTLQQAEKDKPAREAQVARNADGSVDAISRKDGSMLKNVYSKPGQVKYTLSTHEGITEHLYDENDVLIGKIKYGLAIDVSLKTIEQVASLTAKSDRYLKTLFIKDGDGNIRFEVTIKKELTDKGVEEWVGNVTEHQYLLGQRKATIQFAKKLTKQEFDKKDFADLKSSDDRVSQRVYDLDGNVLAEWVKVSEDETGFYKIYDYDALGLQIGERIVLDKLPFAADINLQKVRALNTRHWYDNAGRKIATLDADNYLTAYSYNDKNQVAEKRIYATAMPTIDREASTIIIPETNKETDKVYTYGYDELGRESSIEDSHSGLLVTKEYQNNGLLIIETKTDTRTGDKRVTQQQLNAFGEVIAEASARVSAKMANGLDRSQWRNKIYHPITGLMIQEIDELKSKTIYFYGANRKPVLMINALGEVVRYTYDAITAKPTSIYAYYKRIDAIQLKRLQDDEYRSGFYDEVAMAAILPVVSKNDRKESFELNSDGTLNCHVKVNGGRDFQFINAFGEVEKTKCEVNKDEYLETQLKHDLRGNVRHKIVDPAGKAIETFSKYDDALNRETESTAASGHIISVAYEGLRKQTLQDAEDATRKKTLTKDAFMRTEAETDWQDENAAKHEYNNAERKHTLVSAVSSDRNTSETKNAFNEVVATEVAGNITQFKREVDGSIGSIINPDGSSEATGFDVAGYKSSTTSLLGLSTILDNDLVGRVQKKRDQLAGRELITTFDSSPFGEMEKMIDATGLQVNCIQSSELSETEVTDVAALFLIKQRALNLAGQLVKHSIGDKVDTALYCEIIERDIIGNEKGRKIDLGDNKFAIIHDTIFDKSGHAIEVTNGKGDTTFHVYDKRGNECYTVDEMGFVTQMIYDRNNRLIEEIRYANAANPVDVKNIANSIVKSELNLSTKLLRDADGLVRFELKGTTVVEYRYNGAKLRIDTIGYASEVSIDKPTLGSVSKILTDEKYANHPLNRCKHVDYDEVGRKRLERDPEGSETLYRYDAAGNEVARVQNNERSCYRVYDQFGNLRFKIDAEGYIKERRYNDAHVCTDKFSYSRKLSEVFSVDKLAQLKELLDQEGVVRNNDLILKDLINKSVEIAFPNNDVHMIRILDAAHRVTGNQDGEKNIEEYTLDGMGRVKERKDNRKNLWINKFNKANKLFQEISPKICVSSISKDATTQQLKSENITDSVVSEFRYDDAFNQNQTILATNIESERRTQSTLHDKRSLIEGTVIENAIYASNGVEIKGDITTGILRDYAGRPLIETATNGGREFTVYDQLGRKRYKVDAEGFVIEFRYLHAFGEANDVIYYAERMTHAELKTRQDGLSLAEMQKFVDSQQLQKLNRLNSFTYNRNGQQKTAKKGKAFAAHVYWENGKRLVKVEEFERLLTFDYNKFGERTAEHISRMNSRPDSVFQRFHDKNGNEVVTVTAQGYVTQRILGMQNCRKDGDRYLEESTIQYFNPVPADKRGSLGEILASIIPDARNDRRLSRKFDKRHLCISTTVADGHPFFNTMRESDRSLRSHIENSEVTTGTNYDENGDPDVLTDAYGEKSYLIRNAVGDIEWEIGFPVEVKEGVKQIPVRQFQYNAHRQPVGSTIYYQPGKLEFDDKGHVKLDNIVAASSLDKSTLTLMCNRGLPLFTQENLNQCKKTLFNESRLPVLSTQFVTVPDKNDLLNVVLRQAQRESGCDYNLRNDITMEAKKDEFDDSKAYYEVNAFHERTGEGPAENDYRVHNCFDNVGNKWFSDDGSAIATITFFDEINGDVVSIRSANHDLHDYLNMEDGYTAAKEKLVDPDYETIFTECQQWVTYRNEDGQARRQDSPWSRSRPKLEPENYDLTFTVVKDERPGKSGYLLRFNPPDEVFLKMVFKLRENDKEWEAIDIEMPAESGSQYCYIPLGDRPSNPYEYCLDFFMQNAEGQVSRLPAYRADGEVMLDTGNYVTSTKPIWYMENSNTLVIAGAAANVCGIELLKDGNSVKNISAIRGGDGKLRVNLEHEGLGAYDFKYITTEQTLAENITVGNTGAFSLGLYQPKFIINDFKSLQYVPGTIPPELSAITYDVQPADIPLLCDPPPPRTRDGRSYRINIYAFTPKGEKFDIGSVFVIDDMITETGPKPIACCKSILRVISNDALPSAMALNVDQVLSKVQFKAVTENVGLVSLDAGVIKDFHATLYGLESSQNNKVVGQVNIQNDNSLFVPLEIAVPMVYADKAIFKANRPKVDKNEFHITQVGLHFRWATTLDQPHHLTMTNRCGAAEIVTNNELPLSSPDNIPMYYHQAIPREFEPDTISLWIQTEEGDKIPLCKDVHYVDKRDEPNQNNDRYILHADNHIFVKHANLDKYGDQRVAGFVKPLSHYSYPPSNIIYIKRLPPGTNNVVFEYTYTTSLGEKVWRQAECYLTSQGGLSIFTNDIPAANYACRILCKNGDNVIPVSEPGFKQDQQGYCYINLNITKKETTYGQVFSSKKRDKVLKVVKPFRQMDIDRWNNKRSTTDRKGNTVKSDFNLFNQNIGNTHPSVDTVDAQGEHNVKVLSTENRMNKRGHLVESVDESAKDSRKYLPNQKGENLCVEDADGVQAQHEYDLFSNCLASRAADYGLITSSFQRINGLLVETRTYPNLSTEVITYNEVNHEIKIMNRVARKDNDWDACYIHPDGQGRNRLTINPLSKAAGANKRTTTQKDFHARSGALTRDVNEDGRQQTWSPETGNPADEYVGNIAKHTDLAGQVIVYKLNCNKLILSEVGTVDAIANLARGQTDNKGTPPLPRNLRYLFDEAGREADIIDDAAQLTTRKRYNKEDYCKEYYFIGHDGHVYQATNTTYDELHRIHEICDTRILLEFGYDEKSNRRYAKAVLKDANRDTDLCESWYDYSPAGRVRFRDCILDAINKHIKVVAGKGMEVAYQNGRVAMQSSITADGKAQTVIPQYGEGSAITGVITKTQGESDKTEIRVPDSADRLKKRTVITKDKTIEETFNLDLDSSILSQSTKITAREKGKKDQVSVVDRAIKEKSDLKLVETVVTTVFEVIEGVRLIVTDEITTHYTAADNLSPGDVTCKRLSAVSRGKNPDGAHIDVEAESAKVKLARVVTRNNANGAIVGIGPDAPVEKGTFPDGYREFVVNSENCYLLKETKDGRNYYFYAQKRPGKTTLMAYFGDIPDNTEGFVASALPKVMNMDVNHQSFSYNFPPPYPGKCTADGVKSYRQIAEDLNYTGYADAIAWANNADADSIPAAGTEIKIPTLMAEVPETAYNGALPAIEMLLGSMYPALAMPHISVHPPKVNWVVLVLEMAAAAAATYFTAGALSAQAISVLGAQLGAAAAYGAAGVAGSLASQSIAIAAHQQQGLNVKAMATQATASAVTAGLIGGGSAGAQATEGFSWGDLAMNVATAEAVTAAQQVALMGLGLQSKPDGMGFVTAAFNGAAGTAIKANFGNGVIASGIYTGVTMAGDTLIRGQSLNMDVLSANVVGSMLGSYAGQQGLAYVQSKPSQAPSHQSQAPGKNSSVKRNAPPKPAKSPAPSRSTGSNWFADEYKRAHRYGYAANMTAFRESSKNELPKAAAPAPSSFGQTVKNGFWESIGFINGVGEMLSHPIDAAIGTVSLAYNIGVLAFGADYDGSSAQYFQDMRAGIEALVDKTNSSDPYSRGEAFGTLFVAGASIPLGGEGVAEIGGMLSAGAKAGIKGLSKLRSSAKVEAAVGVTNVVNLTSDEIVPALGRSFRSVNSLFPANNKILEYMKTLPILDSSIDCSEIAQKLFDYSGEAGRMLKITPLEKYGEVLVPEKVTGVVGQEGYVYHYVYQEKGYIYDPRVSMNAIPKGDYMRLLKLYNPDGFNLHEEIFNEMGRNYRRVSP